MYPKQVKPDLNFLAALSPNTKKLFIFSVLSASPNLEPVNCPFSSTVKPLWSLYFIEESILCFG